MKRASSATSLRQSLKLGTADAHRALEATLGLLGPDLDVRRYRHVLELLYGFYSPIEHALARFVGIVPFPLRARAVLLEDDLTTLGLSSSDLDVLPRCAGAPRPGCSDELAGCLYVLEGASLGGQVITRALQPRLGVAKGRGASFFAGDEDQTFARWAVVLEWFEDLARRGASPGAVVAAANATFDALARWMQHEAPSGGDHGRFHSL
jgi:heme oxygenase